MDGRANPPRALLDFLAGLSEHVQSDILFRLRAYLGLPSYPPEAIKALPLIEQYLSGQSIAPGPFHDMACIGRVVALVATVDHMFDTLLDGYADGTTQAIEQEFLASDDPQVRQSAMKIEFNRHRARRDRMDASEQWRQLRNGPVSDKALREFDHAVMRAGMLSRWASHPGK